VERLRDNEKLLTRIYVKFAQFDLPYDYQCREEIGYLHDSRLESVAIKPTQSFVAKKIIEAQKRGDLSALELTADETTVLETLLGAPDENNDDND
jgi:hypothetical protein